MVWTSIHPCKCGNGDFRFHCVLPLLPQCLMRNQHRKLLHIQGNTLILVLFCILHYNSIVNNILNTEQCWLLRGECFMFCTTVGIEHEPVRSVLSQMLIYGRWLVGRVLGVLWGGLFIDSNGTWYPVIDVTIIHASSPSQSHVQRASSVHQRYPSPYEKSRYIISSFIYLYLLMAHEESCIMWLQLCFHFVTLYISLKLHPIYQFYTVIPQLW